MGQPAAASSFEGSHACPHVNRNDPRCAMRFSLGRLDQAFSVCFGAFHGCPMYHRINGDLQRRASSEPIGLTISCRPSTHDVPAALCSTGT